MTWTYEINVADLLASEQAFAHKRAILASRIKRSDFYLAYASTDKKFSDLVEKLQYCLEVNEFEILWTEFKFWCETHEVWVES